MLSPLGGDLSLVENQRIWSTHTDLESLLSLLLGCRSLSSILTPFMLLAAISSRQHKQS